MIGPANITVVPTANVVDVAVIPVWREVLGGGNPVPAYLVVDLELSKIHLADLEAHGIPLVEVSEIGNLSDEEFAQKAISAEDANRFVDRLASRIFEPFTQAATLAYSDSLPVVAYADASFRAYSGWSTDLVSAFDQAASTIHSETGILIYRLYVMTSGMPVNDISNRCEMMQTADYEKRFTVRGHIVTIWSDGDVEGHWGWAINRPVSAQIAGEWKSGSTKWWTNYGQNWGETTMHLPSVYIKHNPYYVHHYMQMLATHEIAHQFTMRHEDADCWLEWGGLKKSVEAYTSDSNTPSGCLDNTMGEYRFVLSATTGNRMWSERTRWSDCVNFGC